MCLFSSCHYDPFHGFQIEGHKIENTKSKVEWVPHRKSLVCNIYNYLANFVAHILDVYVLINKYDFIM